MARNEFLQGEFQSIIGQEGVKRQVKSALAAERNIIIVGQPGIGKTTMARSIAKMLPEIEVLDCGYNCDPKNPVCPGCKDKKAKKRNVKGMDRFIRVQGSPDLTAEDLIGDIDPIKALKYGPLSPQAFTPGKIFKANNGILFFDEINRCSEKLQNALLQALEEKKVTIGSYTMDFDVDFIFIGTMNPEDKSTEPLSDVFLDRFDLVYMQFPERLDEETRIVEMHGKKMLDFPSALLRNVVSFIHQLRADSNVEKKPSVRATLGLYERSQTHAMLRGNTQVSIKDVEAVLLSVLAHRIRLKPSIKYTTPTENYISAEFSRHLERGDCG